MDCPGLYQTRAQTQERPIFVASCRTYRVSARETRYMVGHRNGGKKAIVLTLIERKVLFPASESDIEIQTIFSKTF